MPTIQELLDEQNAVPEFLQPYGPTMSGPGGQQIGTADLGNALPAVRAQQDRLKFNELLERSRSLEQQQLAYQEAHPPKEQGKFSRWLEATFGPAQRYGQMQRRDEAAPLAHMAAEQGTIGNLLKLYQPQPVEKPDRPQIGYPGAMLFNDQGDVLGYNPEAEKAPRDLQPIDPTKGYLNRDTDEYYPPTQEDEDSLIAGVPASMADNIWRSGVSPFREGTKADLLFKQAKLNEGKTENASMEKWLHQTYVHFFNTILGKKIHPPNTPYTQQELEGVGQEATSAMEAALEGYGNVQEPGQAVPTFEEWQAQHPEYNGYAEEQLYPMYHQQVKRGP